MRPAGLGNERHWAWLAVPALALVLGFIANSRYGAGLTPDSVSYLSAADSLLAGNGFWVGEDPLLLWPPVFSLLVAGASLGVIDVQVAASIVNVLAYAGVVLLSVRWLLSAVRNRWLVLCAGLAIVLAPPLVLVMSRAWSEMSFIFFTLLFADRMSVFLTRGRSQNLLLAGLSAGAAALTRYIGVVVIATGVLCLLLTWTARKAPAKPLITFLAVSSTPFGLWLVRNVVVAQSLTGDRTVPRVGLYTVLKTATLNAAEWFIPQRIPNYVTAAVFYAALLGVSFLVWSLFREEPHSDVVHAVAPLLLFLIVYAVALVAVELITVVTLPDDRILSPVFVPLVLTAVAGLDRFLERSELATAAKGGLVALAGILLLTVPAFSSIRFVADAQRYGAGGYARAVWQESEIAAVLREWEPGEDNPLIFSNDPFAAFFLTDLDVSLSPSKKEYLSDQPSDFQIDDLKREAASADGVYLIWFGVVERAWPDWPLLYSVDEIRSEFAAVPVLATTDGTLYRLSPASDR